MFGSTEIVGLLILLPVFGTGPFIALIYLPDSWMAHVAVTSLVQNNSRNHTELFFVPIEHLYELQSLLMNAGREINWFEVYKAEDAVDFNLREYPMEERQKCLENLYMIRIHKQLKSSLKLLQLLITLTFVLGKRCLKNI